MKLNYPNDINNPTIGQSTSYWVNGDEIEYRDHALTSIAKAYELSHQSQRHFIENSADWQTLKLQLSTQDLFTQCRIHWVQLMKVKVDKFSQDLLPDIIAAASTNQIVVIISSKIMVQQSKAKWFQIISKKTTIFTIPTTKPTIHQAWLKAYISTHSIKITPQAIQMLLEQTVNNPSASKQYLQHIKLLYPNTLVDEKSLHQLLESSALHPSYALGDALLAGETTSVINILKSLKQQSVEAPLLLWTLSKITKELLQYSFQIQKGQGLAQVLKAVWSSKKTLYQGALKRLSYQTLSACLRAEQRLDESIKGIHNLDIQIQIENICFCLCTNNLDHLKEYTYEKH